MADKIDKAINSVADTAKNAHDTVTENIHKGKADAEHEKRAEFGDAMTTGQKVESVGNEVSEKAKAGFDHAKRDVRNAD